MGNFSNAFGLTVATYSNLAFVGLNFSTSEGEPLAIDPKAISDEISSKMAESFTDACNQVYNTMLSLCPVSSGALVSSIKMSNSQAISNDEIEVLIQVGSDDILNDRGIPNFSIL